eukprot:TRINITY_DN2924_c0_g1_i1.p1 TRINITY_DN2924_c0_g1~~TRINITY_DN2924_c0_g1_i1.p1  ORF type:complete len:603 (+),score=113.14 TRINITY_DN2924_c0_g1_i1:513-2321(+)
MNQLCVPIPPASDTQQILEDVFALCRIPWIFEFIFNADPAADISMLLAPVQKRHALSARIFVNATETSSRYAHTFDFNKELMFYSIPAFSVENITAGFCVEQLARNKSKDALQCIRFVRDDTNGVFLHVSENQRTGVTEVDCLTHKSSTRRTRVRMKFDCRSLRRVLRTPKGILHPSDISSSLIYYNVSDERRTCPVCVDATAGDCDCKLPLQRPTHPFDFRFEASNMQLYTGFYQGATVVRLWSVGHGSINATLQSGSVIQGELNPEITHRLHRMAVTDRLAKVKENPFALVMPHGQPIAVNAAAHEAMAHLGENVDNDAAVNVFDISSNDEHRMSAIEMNDMAEPLLVAPHAAADVERMAEVAHTDMAQKALVSDSLFDAGADVTNGDLEEADALMEAHEVLGEMHNVCSSNANEDQRARGAITPLMEKDRTTDGCTSSASLSSKREMSCTNGDGVDIECVPLLSGRGSCENLRAFEQCCYEMTDEDAQAGGESAEKAGCADAQVKRKRSRSRTEGGQADDDKVQRVLTEEEKTEIRKKRNREAAARSNLKRKLRNEKVRKDLANLTQKAVKLRVREMMLRDENTRLRNEVRRAKLLVPH